jgi:Rod binding domain-containing protein
MEWQGLPPAGGATIQIQNGHAAARSAGSTSQLSSAQVIKLRKAAAEFEAMMLSTFWKSMKGSFASDDEESTDPTHETLEDMGIQAMSSAVGKAGGLGLGKLILKHLAPGWEAEVAKTSGSE